MAGIEDYSTTPGSNTSVNGISIAEGMPPSNVNDAMRQIMADVRREHSVASLTSSVTISIGESSAGKLHIITDAGKSISAFDSISAGIERELIMDVTGIFVHDDTKMILPGGANLTASAGDTLRFLSEGSGNWRLASYIKRAARFSIASDAETLTNKTIDAASNTISNIAQGNLKTTTGTVSVEANVTAVTNATLPGGGYGFYPQLRREDEDDSSVIVRFFYSTSALPSATFTAYISFDVTHTIADGNDDVTAQQRYVQSSPPYDLGDGEFPFFVFALVASDGRVCATYCAEDPPWAYNGPTDIKADAIEARTGRKLKLLRPVPNALALADPARRDGELERLAGLRRSPQYVPITHALKNADMGIIPHPFVGNDLAGKTVVLLDPMSDLSVVLREMNHAGESVGHLFHKRALCLDNEPLSRKTPNGVIACRATWR